ncbi:MAG: hypothetical protein AAF417_10175 [Pseudomonadota bacterium]
MSRSHFWPGVAFAALSALGAALLVSGLLPVIGGVATARFTVALLGLAYLIFLFSRTETRVGRMSVFVVWTGVAVTGWIWVDSFALYLLLHVLLLWLIRSLYFHGGVLTALIDGALVALGTVCALGTVLKTDSTMLGIWVFFLIQALFSLIPKLGTESSVSERSTREKFGDAESRAEAALTQLIARSRTH